MLMYCVCSIDRVCIESIGHEPIIFAHIAIHLIMATTYRVVKQLSQLMQYFCGNASVLCTAFAERILLLNYIYPHHVSMYYDAKGLTRHSTQI